ncbi:MAG: GHKL domain-containing protein [Actinobacteria bacterium]|nr:GHKL domain-containing protein [Actinomycetota bacterium]
MTRSRRALAEAQRRAGAAENEASRAANEAAILRAALDALPMGVVISEPRSALVVRNREAVAVTSEPGPGAIVTHAVDELLAAATGGKSGKRLLEFDGPPPRSLALSAQPVDAARTPSPAVVTIQDLTDFHRLETVRRDFVGNVSHELRTPIGALTVLAEALTGESNPAVIDRLVERVSIEVERAGRIVDDLLDLSRIEAEGGSSHEQVKLAVVVDGAIERIEPAAQRGNVRVDVVDSGAGATVLGSERQLVSALANLLDNAIKYSEPGSAVTVHARSDGHWTQVAVRDLGIGIPTRDLDRVFERFYRVDRARSRDTGGTGLGLAIVRHVARNHGGDVLVESQEGVGSTFTLRLPTWD